MLTSRLDYHIPAGVTATHPCRQRDDARLMVIRRADPAAIAHARFRELPEFLLPAGLLVRNHTAVLPARLHGKLVDTGGRVQGIYLETIAPGKWLVGLRLGRRRRNGEGSLVLRLHDGQDQPTAIQLRLLERVESGCIVSVEKIGDDGRLDRRPAAEVLADIGATPLPPYIVSARKAAGSARENADDANRYQTTYADQAHPESVAAPTAGLHFTPPLDQRLLAHGVEIAALALHVGIGTFAPVRTEHVEDHPIHAERFEVPAATLQALARARASGRPIINVGTTTCRALESLPDDCITMAAAAAHHGRTRLLITPGYHFRRTDGLITNFHRPQSTLLAMVAALLPEGIDRLLEHYQLAGQLGYRFYSYGDAMLILP